MAKGGGKGYLCPSLNSGINRTIDISPTTAPSPKDQVSVPVVSASQPAVIGDSIEPVPKNSVHRPTIVPEDSLVK